MKEEIKYTEFEVQVLVYDAAQMILEWVIKNKTDGFTPLPNINEWFEQNKKK